jgi:hypothetical protein
MPLYRLQRHVVYDAGCQQTREVWGLDRRPAGALQTRPAPRFTDEDDPLRKEDACCVALVTLPCGGLVTWPRVFEWLSVAEAAGYQVISGFDTLSPYSTIVLRGP